MHIGILGAAEASLGGGAVVLGTRKQRALLAALALHRGRAVPPDTLVDLLWGGHPPTAVTATLQGYVAGLRRALEPDRPARAPGEVLVTREGGYALVLAAGALDAEVFEESVTRAHGVLGRVTLPRASLPGAQALLEELDGALARWRGTPYAELEDAPGAQSERARLEELRAIALEDRAVAGLALGRHATVAAELEVLTTTYPLRERLWGLRALALARSGRQADALEVLRRVRDLLADELGLEPGADLRELQTMVLRQDPALAWTPPAVTPPPARPGGARRVPLVGRDDQLAALVGLLEQSAEAPAFAALTGDPGIGKSRLCAEVADLARQQDVQVLVGRCSQDEGAPPLYPWAQVLADLGRELPTVGEDEDAGDGASRFRAWESIARTLVEASRERHLLVVLDDLHWADTSTLRVLRLLAETTDRGRLLVVSTWRHHPAPTGQLAVVAEMLARRHALRLELAGLSVEEAAQVVTSVAEATPSAPEADALRDRTDGNPFFLVEYARLARDGGDLTALLAEDDPPAAVNDVLTRRIAALPDDTAAALRHASVLGRQFDVAALAAVLGVSEEAVLDRIDPALEAGLVGEFGVDRFRFAHALVRDTAYAAISRSRRARMHARVAEVLAGRAGRQGEVARHWLASGPAYVARAWAAAREAAASADTLYAYDEAVALLEAGLPAVEADADADDGVRFDYLLDLARSYQLTDDLVRLRETVHRALDVARGDAARELSAIGLLVTKALWQVGTFNQVDEVVVAVIRRCLGELPAGDSEARCRAMMSLASEIYYESTIQEREALGEQALAMARRLGDDVLLLDTLLAVPLAIWRPGSAELRFALTGEAVELAGRLGAGLALCTALALQATAASESGRIHGLLDRVAAARARAVEERQLLAQLFLDGLEIPWCAMRGEMELARTLTDRMASTAERIGVPQAGDAVTGAFLMQLMWGDQVEVMLSLADQVEQVRVMPINASVALIYARAGRHDEARDRLAHLTAELSPDWWFSLLSLAMAAEAALRAGVPHVAARAYERLSPYAGMPAAGGSGTIVGVTDQFLAMAAQATGERDLATRHADEADRWCTEWEIPLAASWFAGVREEFGF